MKASSNILLALLLCILNTFFHGHAMIGKPTFSYNSIGRPFPFKSSIIQLEVDNEQVQRHLIELIHINESLAQAQLFECMNGNSKTGIFGNIHCWKTDNESHCVQDLIQEILSFYEKKNCRKVIGWLPADKADIFKLAHGKPVKTNDTSFCCFEWQLQPPPVLSD